MMIKVVLDTNIFISSIFWDKGKSHGIVGMALDKRIAVFTSFEILEELERVLRRDFEEPDEMVHRQVSLILDYATVVKPNLKLQVVDKDPDDNKIIECAASCHVDYIITGDKHLLDLKEYNGIRIVTASQFIELAR